MKIIHICPAYYPALGGAETHMKELSELLAGRGHEVTVLTSNVRRTYHLCLKIDGGLPSCEIIHGVRIFRYDPGGGLIGRILSRWYRVKGGYRSLKALLGETNLELLRGPMTLPVIPYILRNKADVVAVMNWWFPMAYQAYLARKLKKFTLIGYPLFHTVESWSRRQLVRKMTPIFDAIIANTAHEATFAKDLNARFVRVGGVGIWPSTFKIKNGLMIRDRYRIKDSPVVGFVGRTDELKGAVLLLEAMRAVWKWNERVRLILAGPLPDESGEMAKCMRKLGQEERERIVQIHDFSEEEKASIYDSFDVFVLPSIAESFGIAYLEAWMCEKPVIGGRIGSTQSVIQEHVDGLLADPFNSDDLARQIILLLKDRSMRRRMGQAGLAKTMSMHTWEKVADRVEQTYQEVIDFQTEAAQCMKVAS